MVGFQTTVTRKGQITFPKDVLRVLGLGYLKKVRVQVKPDKTIHISSLPDILDLAGQYRPRKRLNALRLREKLEKQYERR